MKKIKNNKIILQIINKRLLISGLIFLSISCNEKKIEIKQSLKLNTLIEKNKIINANLKIDSAKKIITTGDLILRTGNDFTSQSLRSLNQRDKTYSHCGIASVENDTIFIYHALGGDWNPDEKICRDAIEIFANPKNNNGIGIYNFNLSNNEIKQLMQTVISLYKMGITFDMQFDLNTNDKMYCAEFVYKSYLLGTNGKLQFTLSHIGNFKFIGVDDLFLNPFAKLKKRYFFNNDY